MPHSFNSIKGVSNIEKQILHYKDYTIDENGNIYSSLQKYGYSNNVRIERIGVTTIENIEIIENLDQVE